MTSAAFCSTFGVSAANVAYYLDDYDVNIREDASTSSKSLGKLSYVWLTKNGEKTIYNPQMSKRDKPIKSGGMKESDSAFTKNFKPLNKTYEYIVPKDIFESILIGEIYPGCIRKESRVNYICEDFICLNCSKYEEEYYKKIYDDDFFICRDIVRKKLNEK